MHQNKKERIEAALGGDHEALSALLTSVQDGIFNLSLRMLGLVPDAEDATQEILIRIMTSLSGFRGDSAFSTWVYRIAVNYLKTCRKSIFAQRPLSFEAYGEDISQGFIPAEDGVDCALLSEELKLSCSNVMLQCLDPESRCIFIFGTMFRADSRVAGEILNLTPENYRQRLSRSRKRMSAFLQEYCGLAGGQCDCKQRIGFAMRTHRLSAQAQPFHSLSRRDEALLAQYKEEMERIDESAQVFGALPCYHSPVEARRFLQDVLQSDAMRHIREV